jgi:sulfhydrogenase subunit delta
VDAYLRGCPVVPAEFLHLVKSMLHGTTPYFPPDAVCVECKKNGNECVLERGDTCMGPVTWGGCNSICVNNGYVCDGCRGTLPHANIDSHITLMREHNIADEDIRDRYRLFLGAEPIGRGV